jgi:hypothetical protein
MLTSFTFWLVVVAVLISYLGVSVWLRRRVLRRAEQARLRALARAFDASLIAPQIKLVRQDYAASAHPRWPSAHYRSELFAAARRLVTGFAYFRVTRHEHEFPKPDG